MCIRDSSTIDSFFFPVGNIGIKNNLKYCLELFTLYFVLMEHFGQTNCPLASTLCLGPNPNIMNIN